MEIGVEYMAVDPERRDLEIVERKGIGHPDSLCDRAAEEFSKGLSRAYLKHAGRILHHNVDKALLSAGRTRVVYGGGEWLAPITFTLAGQATTSFGGRAIPVEEIAAVAVGEAVRPLRNLSAEGLSVRVVARPTAVDLQDLFERGERDAIPLANDTSIGVGFAPFTRIERLATTLESRLNDAATKRRHPAVGEDVKVMAVRRGSALQLTVAAAMVSRFVPDSPAYRDAVEAVRALSRDAARESGFPEAAVWVNAADELGRSEYLTLSGTSAEAGDDGQVGRGNRLSGLITPMRPMTLEAFAGKNARSHVGKLYSLCATRVAEACAMLQGVRAAECFLVSRIGSPITEPQCAGLRLDAEDGGRPGSDDEAVRAIVAREVGRLPDLWRELVAD